MMNYVSARWLGPHADEDMWTSADREIYRETSRRYPSDLSDEEWGLISPFFADYRPVSAAIREIVEARLYLVAEGCRWRALPKDFPPWQTVQGKRTRSATQGNAQAKRRAAIVLGGYRP